MRSKLSNLCEVLGLVGITVAATAGLGELNVWAGVGAGSVCLVGISILVEVATPTRTGGDQAAAARSFLTANEIRDLDT